MKKVFLGVLIMFLTLFLCFDNNVFADSSSASGTSDAVTSYSAKLSGLSEIPAISTSATGSAKLVFNADKTQAMAVVNVLNGESIIMAHIHCDYAKENGPEAVVLISAPNQPIDISGVLVVKDIKNSDILKTDCTPNQTVSDLAQAAAQGRLYVNIHSTVYQNGLLRGQFVSSGSGAGNTNVSNTSKSGQNINLGQSFQGQVLSATRTSSSLTPEQRQVIIGQLINVLKKIQNILIQITGMIKQLK